MQPVGQDIGSVPFTNQRVTRLKHAPRLSKYSSQQSLESNASYETALSSLDCESLDDFRGLTGQEPIIAIMGPTGAGKSTFIKVATGSDHVKIGDDLASCTRQSQVIRCHNPLQNCDVLFVDTPGFNDTTRSDVDILQGIAKWLEETYRCGFKLSGILYLHRITDNRMSNTLLRNLDLFHKLCGDDALSNIRLVTTNWDLLPNIYEGERIEKELCEKYWKPFIESGAQVHRFQYSCASAWEIVSSLPMERKSMQIQKELVDENKHLAHTAAGQKLFSSATQVLRDLISWLEAVVKKVTSLSPSSNTTRQSEDEKKLEEAKEDLHRIEKLQHSPSRELSRLRRHGSVLSSNGSILSTVSGRSSIRSVESQSRFRRGMTRLQQSWQRDTTATTQLQPVDVTASMGRVDRFRDTSDTHSLFQIGSGELSKHGHKDGL